MTTLMLAPGTAMSTDVAERSTGSVGRLAINHTVPGPCNAVLVGASRAVTARHCAFSRGSNEPKDGLVVVIGDARRSVIGHHVAPHAAFDAEGRFAHPRHDWAYLELAGAPAATWIEVAGQGGLILAELEGGVLTKVGWAGERLETSRCSLLDTSSDGAQFAFRCGEKTGNELGAGRSGSGLFVRTERGLALVGVHVAAVDEPAPGFGIAVVPPRLVD